MEFLSRDSPTWASWRISRDSENPELRGKDAEISPPSLLYYATEIGLKNISISLITERNVNKTSTLGRSPLGIAGTKGFIEVVQAILQKRADITAPGQDRMTPINVASFNGHVKVVKLLHKNGADVTVANNFG